VYRRRMPKRAPKPPILLQQRLPFQGQTWTDIGQVWEHGAAQDALSLPEPRPLPGTLLRAVERRSVTWAGVADGNGLMLPLPPIQRVDQRPQRGVSTWFHAWDGTRATYRWMLEAATKVDRSLFVMVALAALATIDGEPFQSKVDFDRAVEALRAWLRGEGSVEAVEEAEARLVELDGAGRLGRAEEAAYQACRIVPAGFPTPATHTQDVLHTVIWIAGRPPGKTASDPVAWAAANRAQVESIRAIIPLGLVILSRVEDARPYLEKRAARRNYSQLG